MKTDRPTAPELLRLMTAAAEQRTIELMERLGFKLAHDGTFVPMRS
jgi:hypothetical protein